MLESLTEGELVILGHIIANIGTHSWRKGSGTYCNGQVSGPNPVAITLRMGHSIGKMRDKYIFMGDGADQLCGRMLAGLPFNDSRFATLPPHFTSEGSNILTEDLWKIILPHYEKYPEGKN